VWTKGSYQGTIIIHSWAREEKAKMSTTRAALEEYCGFIQNPQRDGVWSLRIELTEKQAAAIGTFLNIEP
jgi:hypothetical protein